ncbi:Na+/H+ antiporter subunit C [Ectothiorhodospira mobilis]|nr:NADH-quinone oxidoreductase subunit K [Ectothiorhodospira mobilis]MBK1692936.1 Na+/H+ antiporter subunit C [Ectothiorhodospira mobilis]
MAESLHAWPFFGSGVLLFVLGLHALVTRPHLLIKVLAFNVMGSGTFMVLLSAAARGSGEPDPVPQALVITGIVVAVSATAVALALMLRLYPILGGAGLPPGPPED